MIEIIEVRLIEGELLTLLEEHMVDMYNTSPPENVHTLDRSALKQPDVTFWRAELNNSLVGCIALKELSHVHGEIKSMRTQHTARQQGVGSALLAHTIDTARARGYHKLSLETGSMAFFKPARRLYKRFDFQYCPPFAHYTLDANSLFMCLQLID